MTSAIVAAIHACSKLDNTMDWLGDETEPSVNEPAVGKPISHTQLLAVSKLLRKHTEVGLPAPCHLDELLRGSRIYYEPPKPKAEPVRSATAICRKDY